MRGRPTNCSRCIICSQVIRKSRTQALARAAAIDGNLHMKNIGFFRIPSLRNPKTARVLIGFIWALTMAFIVTPLKFHCHEHITRCYVGNGVYSIFKGSEVITQAENKIGENNTIPQC